MNILVDFGDGCIVDLVGAPAGPGLRRCCRGPWGPIRRAKSAGRRKVRPMPNERDSNVGNFKRYWTSRRSMSFHDGSDFFALF